MSHLSIAELAMLVALVVLVLFHGLIFIRILFHKDRTPERSLPVTVLICAQNEGDTLRQNLPAILEQDHADFEVLVMDDGSEDDTRSILMDLGSKYPRLRVQELRLDDKFRHGKKVALGLGIKAAKYEHVLLTDADCWPSGKDWISLMAAGFDDRKKVVVAHSPYEERPGFPNLLERYDGTMKAMYYLGFAKAGIPYMGVGRNMAYDKQMFFNAKNLHRTKHLMSGDDDLLINSVASASNTTVALAKGSFMTTRATADLSTWWHRKRRHYTTAIHYRMVHKLLLMLLPVARALFWAALFVLIIQSNWRSVLVGITAYLVLVHSVTMGVMHKLAGKTLLPWALALEWLFLLLDPILYLSTLLSRPRRWK